VEQLKPAAAVTEISDVSYTPRGRLRRGFILRVTPGGKKSWLYRFKDNGKSRKLAIGDYPQLSLAEARDLFDELRRAVDDGHRPAQALAAHRIEQGTPQPGDGFTVSDLVDHYLNSYAKIEKRSWKEDARQFDADLLPVYGKLPADQLTRRQAIELIESVQARGHTAARLLKAACSKAYEFAIERDKGSIENNPFRNIKIYKPKTEESGPACLNEDDDADLKTFRGKLPVVLNQALQDVLMLQLYTGCRKGEVCGAAWSEINLENKVWILPAARSKNKRKHRIMLSRQAVKLLKRREKLTDGKGFVFTSHAACGHLRGDSINEALSGKVEKFGIGHFTPHAMRHTTLTGLARLKCPRETISLIANHTTDKTITDHYIHAEDAADEQKRKWLQKWGNHLDSLVRS
jgi:integrase